MTRRFVLLLYLAVSGIAFGYYRIALGRGLQSRYQDYRAIAEGLRVQDWWRRAGLHDTVADHYLRSQRGELDWIRDAIRVSRMLEPHAPVPAVGAADAARLRDVYRDWIAGPDGQTRYFTQRIERLESLDRRRARGSFTLVAASFVLAALLALASNPLQLAALQPIEIVHESPLWRAVIVAICLCAVGSALLQGYARIHAFREHARQYDRMRSVYEQARAALAPLLDRDPFTAEDEAAAREIFKELGVEALAEHAAWVMLHRERPLEYVHGG